MEKKEFNIDGKIYRLVEEEKPVLKVGEWYQYYDVHALVLNNEHNSVGVYNELWFEELNGSMDTDLSWQPANMKEVKKLLIKEAEKRYGTTPRKDINLGDTFFFYRGDVVTNGWFNNRILFDSKTGLWDDIVEEKKPLYVNSFGTEFFEGYRVYYLISGNEIPCSCTIENMPKKQMKGNDTYTEIMTKKECYQWLADNCNE